ncbi:site-specific DNA-methyltransferase, partial [Corynebacterium stationis]
DKQSGVLKGRVGMTQHGSGTNSVYGTYERSAQSLVSDGVEDSGGASRFFPVFKYQAKAPKRERPVIEREDGTKIQHATVKPLALMEWLVSLIVPPGGVVLDPFAGSGTTLQAAINKGFHPIGIEQDADYIKLIEQRLAA